MPTEQAYIFSQLGVFHYFTLRQPAVNNEQVSAGSRLQVRSQRHNLKAPYVTCYASLLYYGSVQKFVVFINQPNKLSWQA
jgi:hypothetical protein